MVDFPLDDLAVGKFAGLGGIAGGGRDSLRDLLNLSRLENRLGVIPVSKTLPGAFRSFEEAVSWGRRKTPETKPATPVFFALDSRDEFVVDLDLEPTHSYFFLGLRSPNMSDERGGIKGRLGTVVNPEASSPYRQPRLYFDRVTLGLGSSAANALILETRYGWRVNLVETFAQGLWAKFFHDPLVTSAQAFIRFETMRVRVNQFFVIDYINDAKSTPSTNLFFTDSDLFAEDTPHSTPNVNDFALKGRAGYLYFERCKFWGMGDGGPGVFAGKNALAGGTIHFRNCFWDVFNFDVFNLFGPNMTSVPVFWDGRNVLSSPLALAAMNLGGTGTNWLAPELIHGIAPLNPPVGTRRRDVGGTEKDLFWNGVAWV